MTSNKLLVSIVLSLVLTLSQGFSTTTRARTTTTTATTTTRQARDHRNPFLPFQPSSSSRLNLAYVPQDPNSTAPPPKKPKSLHPKVGDIVRYYDLDGGNKQGQELVGKITFLSQTSKGWIAELTELEDVGDAYYAEYSSQKRMSKKTDREIRNVSPIVASFVRSEQAFKIPLEITNRPRVRQEMYDLDDFEGVQMIINQDVVASDAEKYGAIKTKLLKNAALTGLFGAVLINILKGPEDAIIYFFGALGSIAYLYFLSIKTDTLASADTKLGKNVSNVRFLMPVFVIVGVALYNQSRGEMNPLKDGGMFDTVTAEQFGSAVSGFLTYRIPLFLGQLQDGFNNYEPDKEEGGIVLPGSAGVAMKLAKSSSPPSKDTKNKGISSSISSMELIPVLLVSGPQATGRSELIQRLLEEDDRLVAPKFVDRIQDGVTFERLMSRNEFLEVDATGRFGLTKDSILQAAAANNNNKNDDDDDRAVVVVVDASVSLAKELQSNLSGARLIGVWVGLNSVSEFEERLVADIESGKISIPPDENRESVIRARIKEIVNEIDYGISSGIFEFTILNEAGNMEKSLEELKEAAGYCFK